MKRFPSEGESHLPDLIAMETTPHKPWYIVLVVANLVLLLALFFLNAANGAQDLSK